MRRLALLAALTLVAAGCGTARPGEKVVLPTPSTVVGEVPKPPAAVTVPAEYANGDAAAGKAVFTSAGCGACHTLKDAGSTGMVGPNLDDAKPDLARAIDRLTHGKGAMPSFKGQLSDKQIADVAAYVVKATH